MSPRTSADQTRRALIDAAINQLEAHGSRGLRTQAVLNEANVSSSSLYHHFGNRDGLVAAAHAERYRRRAQVDPDAPLISLPDVASPEEFLAWVAARLTHAVGHDDAIAMRRSRLDAAASALDRPGSPDTASDVERERRRQIARVLDEAQDRGLINPDLDTHAYTALLQGMAVAHAVTSSSFDDTSRWLAVAIPAMLSPLRLPQPA